MSISKALTTAGHTPLSDDEIADLITRYLTDWKAKCERLGADIVILSQGAFGKSRDELFLLGLAAKYAGIVGKDVAITAGAASPFWDRPDHRQLLAKEAKAIVALAFRNGPIESLHAEKKGDKLNTRRITGEEMTTIMKNAVDHVYRLLRLKAENPRRYESEIEFGTEFTTGWDDPAEPTGIKVEVNRSL